MYLKSKWKTLKTFFFSERPKIILLMPVEMTLRWKRQVVAVLKVNKKVFWFPNF